MKINQIPLEEESFFVPGGDRRLFELDGILIGTTICHEGWRYPESVRWAAARGAKIVFHPNFCGAPGPTDGAVQPRFWGDTYYEKAMVCRAGENHIWFVSVNFVLPVQESVSAVVSPEGHCIAATPLNEPALLVVDIDPKAATGFLARRFAPERYLSA